MSEVNIVHELPAERVCINGCEGTIVVADVDGDRRWWLDCPTDDCQKDGFPRRGDVIE